MEDSRLSAKEIGIVTPYQAQVNLINHMLREVLSKERAAELAAENEALFGVSGPAENSNETERAETSGKTEEYESMDVIESRDSFWLPEVKRSCHLSSPPLPNVL